MMNELDPLTLMPLFIIGYVDIGTGQVIASTVGPFLAAGLSLILGVFGFFLLRFKKIIKKIRPKHASKKSRRSRD
jgi:UPF0716 family protein affecting phage T7 exclusion